MAVALTAEIRPRLYITTNYDDGMEQALAARGVQHDLVWYQVARREAPGVFVHQAPGAQPVPVVLPDDYTEFDLDERPVVLKIHGAVHRDEPKEDSFVITEDNYIDYLGRADPWQQLPIDLRARSAEEPPLPRLRPARLEPARPAQPYLGRARRGLAHWSIQHKPSLLEEKLWLRRGNVELYDAPLRSYVSCLERRIRGALAETLPEHA